MKCIKNQLIAFILSFNVLFAVAQVKIPVTNDDLRVNLQKVVADFPYHLSSLKADTIEVNAQTIEFASLLDFKIASRNWITQYISPKPVHSWEAILLETEEYEEGVKKYKWLYNQLKVMTIKTDGGYTFSLDGKYDEPLESKAFSSSVFKMTPNAVNMPKLKIEAALHFEFPGTWKVSLLVYEKEREDKDRGDIKGD